MNKVIIIVFLLIVGGLAYAFYLGMENPPVSLTLSSPNKTYTVQLNEKADRFILPIHISSRAFNSEVRFNAFKGEQLLAENELLWSDSSDGRLDVYKYRWVSDSVLKYGWDETMSDSKMDEIAVFNDTNQLINELVVNASDHFLILDIQPKTTVKLLAYPQSWSSWLSCKGKFSNGNVAGWSGTNFSIHDFRENHIPQHYCITVKDNELLIQSREIEGYKDVNGVDVTVPKCGINL